MLAVLTAYFATIVVFAGLYLTVNYVGVRYYGGGGGGGESWSLKLTDGYGSGVGSAGEGMSGYEGQEMISLGGSGTEDVKVPSFCGMEIDSMMDGEYYLMMSSFLVSSVFAFFLQNKLSDLSLHLSPIAAMYFSLSTMATIGYGTSDYYFGNCWTPFVLVLLQVFSALAFSSLAIGLLFQRMSRGQKRGRTIVFSDVAVIRKVRGEWYWMFRVAELRKQHIIGAKVRVFCVRHERCPMIMGEKDIVEGSEGSRQVVELETAHYVSHPMLILNGSLNSSQSSNASTSLSPLSGEKSSSDCAYEQSILMGLPHVVVHRMDGSSPMMPSRPIWYDERGVPHGPSLASSADGASGDDAASSSSLLATVEEGKTPSNDDGSQEEITHFLQDRHAEIIVFLEGTCEVTGMALQARHSYRIEDIAFNHTFAPCVFPTAPVAPPREKKWWTLFDKSKAKVDHTDHSEVSTSSYSSGQVDGGEEVYNSHNAALEIDFCQFHDLIQAPSDCLSCPYVSATSHCG
jgi:hypothetical protein